MGNDFDKLLAQCREWLLGIARGLCVRAPGVAIADDLVQHAIMRFIESGGRAWHDAKGRVAVRNRLITIINNYFCDQLRSAKGRRQAELDPTVATYMLKNDDDVPATFENITSERFEWAIEKLPPKQRMTFLLKAQKLENKEIARRLGISQGAVAQRLFNARQTLNDLLKPYLDEGVQ